MPLPRSKLPVVALGLLPLALATCVLDPDPVLPPIAPGHAMAYVSGGLGFLDDLYLLTADGQEGNITQFVANDSWPSWSPTGTSLAFQSDRDRFLSSEIYIVSNVGTPSQNVQRVTNDTAHQDAQPAWSPLGNRLAFVSDRDSAGLDIYLRDPVAGDDTVAHVTRLTNDATNSAQPAWSPAGDRIAFVSDRTGVADIFVMDTLGGNVVNVTNSAASDLSPAWSPDGTKIAFHSTRDGIDYSIWVMNANGTNLVQISGSAPPCELPHWTPDGLRLAFDCDGDIWVANAADGTNLTRITRTSNSQRLESRPRWRP